MVILSQHDVLVSANAKSAEHKPVHCTINRRKSYADFMRGGGCNLGKVVPQYHLVVWAYIWSIDFTNFRQMRNTQTDYGVCVILWVLRGRW